MYIPDEEIIPPQPPEGHGGQGQEDGSKETAIARQKAEAIPFEDRRQKGLSIRTPDGTEIEVQNVMDFSARFDHRFRATGSFRCGNCGVKIVRTNDPVMDHHLAMKHAYEECAKRGDAESQRVQLLAEYAEQLNDEANRTPKQPYAVPERLTRRSWRERFFWWWPGL